MGSSDCVVIGEVTDSGKMELFWYGEKSFADIPVAPVELKRHA